MCLHCQVSRYLPENVYISKQRTLIPLSSLFFSAFIFFVNIRSIKASLILNTGLTVAKIAALIFIILTGIVYLCLGR